MKKFAICCLALVVAAMFAPAAQAATKCYHLTNFCDVVQASNFLVGGVQGTEVVGLWDWQCAGVGTGTLVSGTTNKFGTRPIYYPYGSPTSTPFFANGNFTFKNIVGVGKVFDLYGTADGLTTFAFQLSQPWTTTAGPCSPLSPAQKALPRSLVIQ